MNNNDIAEALAADHGLTKADARKLVDSVFATITTAAGKGEEISLNGFGKFKVKASPAREGRNPQDPTKVVKIPAKKVPVFRPGKDLKEKVLSVKPKKKVK